MRKVGFFLLLIIFFQTLFNVPGYSQERPKDFNLGSIMKPEDFSKCGLKKLNKAELEFLNDWLFSFSGQLAKVVAEKSAQEAQARQISNLVSPALPTESAIETNIEGEFNGWEGETIFKLDNGQIWQQAEYAYMYHYSYRPEITIYKTDSGYRMKVEDVEETILVKRIK